MFDPRTELAILLARADSPRDTPAMMPVVRSRSAAIALMQVRRMEARRSHDAYLADLTHDFDRVIVLSSSVTFDCYFALRHEESRHNADIRFYAQLGAESKLAEQLAVFDTLEHLMRLSANRSPPDARQSVAENGPR